MITIIYLFIFLLLISVPLQLLHSQCCSQVPLLPAAAEGRGRQGQRVCCKWWLSSSFFSLPYFLFQSFSGLKMKLSPVQSDWWETSSETFKPPKWHAFHQEFSPLFAALHENTWLVCIFPTPKDSRCCPLWHHSGFFLIPAVGLERQRQQRWRMEFDLLTRRLGLRR